MSAVDVLVLDDDASVAVTTRDILRRAGMSALSAVSVPEAIELTGSNCFDAVVLDHHLGGQSGEHFLEQAPDVGPVVIVSAATPELLEEIRLRQGQRVFAVRYKPIAPERLIEVVRAAVDEGRRRQRDASFGDG